MTAQPETSPDEQTLPGIELPATTEALMEFAWAAHLAGPVNINRLSPPAAPERQAKQERIDRRVMLRG